MTLRAALDKLAAEIAKKAAEDATSLQESVDALKALVPYYALLQKLKGKDSDKDDDADNFDAFSADIAATEQKESANGRTAKIRSRQ